jgi:2-methylcitrate dehydratase PrpD
VIGLGLAAHREGIEPDSIASIQIGLGEYNHVAVGADYEPARDNVVHAQFNAAYSFARALADGKVGFQSYQRPAITDPAIAALTAVTHSVIDPGMEKNAVHPARINMVLKNGETKEWYSDAMKGSPRDPMSRDELLTKFRACLDYGFGAGRDAADRFAAVILGIESSPDAGRALVEAFPTTHS